jgi:cytohesin
MGDRNFFYIRYLGGKMEGNQYISGLKVLLSAAFILSTVEQGSSVPFALHLATLMREGEIVIKLLVNHGKNVNEIDSLGEAPMHLAVWPGTVLKSRWNRIDIVKILIDYNANVNIGNGLGNTPLHLAAWRGDIEIVKYLVNHGAEVNTRNNDNETPLGMAENDDVYNFLVTRGAHL